MIRFENVYKSFGSKKVLNGISFHIQKGSTTALLGKSGTGKSVILQHIIGFLKADQGEIWVNGENISKLDEEGFLKLRKFCSIIFQLPALFDSKNVFENVSFGIRKLPYEEKVKRTAEALRQVELPHFIKNMHSLLPGGLSYGEQKRLSIARSLLIEPEILLFDEPTTGIDPITAKTLHKLIRDLSLQLNKTSVIVSHDMKNALDFADEVFLLDAGQVVDRGHRETLLKSQHPLTRNFLKDFVI